ncbi:hypothetical protein AVEN_115584-1 [Araneus ventricosus]|uniref:DUF4817 domain-containing protein n=1 Tax=Araneus ventricosus TaxID=182803 RepID=A0A4Y2T656_ARAVE|nr:hypothetical protein AVEN_115584-1 [Araneus ventricosus]
MGNSQRKFQNGYRAAESTSDTSLVLRKQINCNISKSFRQQYRNCHSPSRNSINRWYEQFKGTGNVHHRKGVGRPSVTDEVVHRGRRPAHLKFLYERLIEFLLRGREFRYSNRKCF